jgi:hypothetical protein
MTALCRGIIWEHMQKQQPGFIKIIILVLVLIVILSYFKFDIKGFVESPEFQQNWNYVWGYVKEGWDYAVNFWNTYLRDNAIAFWEWFKANNHAPVIAPVTPSA